MSDTFTKLASNIITSSIWSEDDKTRIVWITLLALCDQDGFAETSIPGLSAVARVPLADTVKAVEKLSSPDAFSRTTEHEGRRITAVEGGFVILNHAKYRDKARGENRKEYIRGYMRDYMRNVRQEKSNKCLTDVKPSVSVSVSVSDSVLEKEVKEEEKLPFDSEAFQAAWNEWKKFRSEIRKSLKPSTIKKQLAFLAKLGEEKAIKSMGTSILNGWQGLFEPEEKGANGNEKKEKPIWRDCAARCRFWSDKWKSCDKRETVEPKSCECCTWFR